jgi:hypothetical protein
MADNRPHVFPHQTFRPEPDVVAFVLQFLSHGSRRRMPLPGHGGGLGDGVPAAGNGDFDATGERPPCWAGPNRMTRLIAIGAILLVAYFGLLFLAQRRLVFQPPPGRPPPDRGRAEVVRLRVPSVGSVEALYLAPQADVDLAVRGLRPEQYFSALARVNEVAQHAVDLVTLETCSRSLRHAVETTGVRIDDE